MSRYENYDRVSEHYDHSRSAVGIEILLGYLLAFGTTGRVLDAGCGTGNYTVGLHDLCEHVVGLDFSGGMLRQAQAKFAATDRPSFVRGDMARLPFAAQRFDAIVCNQSIHHLDEPGSGFGNHRSFFRRGCDLLVDGGALLINTISHVQLADGVWWGELIRPAVERMQGRFLDVDDLAALLEGIGFEVVDRVVPLDTIIQSAEQYRDPLSLLDPAFRAGDSHFSLLEPDELEHVLGRVRGMHGSGELGGYVAGREALRRQTGQFTVVVARKAAR